MKKKTVLQLALMSVCATLLLIAGVTFAANAEPVGGDCGVNGDNVKWEFHPDSGELRIYGEGEMMNVSSPQYPWEKYREEIKIITIEDGVTNIGDEAFFSCSNLNYVDLPDSLICIGVGAFDSCGNLASISVPNSVTYIGDGAFGYCRKLTNVDIPNRLAGISDGTFRGCYSLISLKIPDSITTIGAAAFESCISLTNIVIPNRVTNIGYAAFWGCKSLKSITIGRNVTDIKSDFTPAGYIFDGCDNLKFVYIKSPDIVNQLVNETSCSLLISHADTVYINSAITEVSDYITTNFPYTHTAVHDGTAYTAYSKTPIVHDTLEGYIQFRPGDGVYDARVLVEGKSDFMEDYTSATVTLTFTKSGDSNKTLTMTALADQAYTSVVACGQRKDARPGYGFIGLVVTGIGNADVGTISASVTLTAANGDTVTYDLGRVDNVPDYVGHPIA